VTLFSDPARGGYRAHRAATAAHRLWLPGPFGIELDAGPLVG
jgi:hypothetical protein